MQVRTRSHAEKGLTPQQMARQEEAFFEQHPRPAGIKPQAGLQALSSLLLSTQSALLRDKMPEFTSQARP